MIGDPFTMVVAIVLITAVASVLRARYKAQHGLYEDDAGKTHALPKAADNQAQEAEIKALKERIAVLERIATDDTRRLDMEFEKLRDN